MGDYLDRTSEERAYGMGDRAATDRELLPCDNPFHLGDPRHESWMRGYIDGPGILRAAS